MFICDIFELWKTTPPSSGSHTRCTCWIWFPAHSPVKMTEVQTLPYAETKPCWLHLSYMKSKPNVHTQPHNITGPSLSIQLQVSYLEKYKIKIVRAFFFAPILLLWHAEVLARAGAAQPQSGLPAVALVLLCVVCLGCACMEGRDHAKMILCKKCHFPALTRQPSLYLCPVIQGRSPLLRWWDCTLIEKMSG